MNQEIEEQYITRRIVDLWNPKPSVEDLLEEIEGYKAEILSLESELASMENDLGELQDNAGFCEGCDCGCGCC